jgi:hypothetical protein
LPTMGRERRRKNSDLSSLVIAGLDPAIHFSSTRCFLADGCAGQARA